MYKIKDNFSSNPNYNYSNTKPLADINLISLSRMKKLTEFNASKTMAQFNPSKTMSKIKSQNFTKFENITNQSPKISLGIKRNYSSKFK